MLFRQVLGMTLACLLGLATVAQGLAADDKKDDKDDPNKKGGTVTGTVAAKGENWIEVKGDGEEKARRYTPNWVGGAPAAGGGFDKDILKAIAAAPVGARVKLEWKFQERPRVVKIEVVKKDGDKKESEKK